MNLRLSGIVETGEGMATELGCPTANVAVEHGAIIPGLGIYVGEAWLVDERYPALVCINDGRTGYTLKMEVHLLGQKLELVGKRLNVELFEKVRDLIPFPGDEKMREQIAVDLVNARAWFAERGVDIPKKSTSC